MSHFDQRAKTWDNAHTRVNGAQTIANAIKERITLREDMEIIDFGVGTGLLGFIIAEDVKKVYGIDTSIQMLAKVEEKNSAQLNIKTIHQDIIENPLTQIFNGLVSSMTLHHVENLKAFFDTIYKNIHKDGFIAIADLKSEDGTFHSDNTGVFHFGFKDEELCNIVEQSGFKNVQFEKINVINKPQGDFEVFLLTATK